MLATLDEPTPLAPAWDDRFAPPVIDARHPGDEEEDFDEDADDEERRRLTTTSTTRDDLDDDLDDEDDDEDFDDDLDDEIDDIDVDEEDDLDDDDDSTTSTTTRRRNSRKRNSEPLGGATALDTSRPRSRRAGSEKGTVGWVSETHPPCCLEAPRGRGGPGQP